MDSKYNLNALSFLIGSLRDVVNNFGANDKSAAFYRSQVNNLVNLGQLNEVDANLVEELVDLDHLNHWNSNQVMLDKFTYCINIVLSNACLNGDIIKADADRILSYINNTEDTQYMRKSVKLARKVLGVPENKTESKPNWKCSTQFGTNKFSQKAMQNNKPVAKSVDKSVDNKTYNLSEIKSDLSKSIIKAVRPGMVLDIKNINAVCSSDTPFFRYKLQDVIRDEKTILEIITKFKNGYPVMIGELIDDGCHIIGCNRNEEYSNILIAKLNEYAKLI